MWSVYVIQNDLTQEIYMGVSSELKQRLSSHNAGDQVATRRKQGAWKLIYAEAFRVKDDAVRREHQLKHHGSAKQELLKRIKHSLL